MRTSKIITLIFIFIIFAFLQVFLQTETIKLGYQVKKNEDKLQEDIENNRILKYNIYALESPYSLERYVMAEGSNLKNLEPFQLLSLFAESKAEYANKKDKRGFLFDNYIFLSLKKLFTGKQAEAKTIK